MLEFARFGVAAGLVDFASHRVALTHDATIAVDTGTSTLGLHETASNVTLGARWRSMMVYRQQPNGRWIIEQGM